MLVSRSRSLGPKMNRDYKVQKQKIEIHLLMREMSTEELWAGDVFIHEHSEFHTGQQQLEEFLNQDNPFFPLHFKKGGFSLVNKENIIYMQVNSKDVSMYLECGIKPQRIQVFFKEHHSLEGDIFPELPPDRSRPLDFFNQGIRFLPMFLEKQKVVINTQHVLYIKDGGQEKEH